MVKKKIGQITIKRIGDKFAVCISGNPQELFNTFKLAEHVSEKLRKKYGRKKCRYKSKKKKGY